MPRPISDHAFCVDRNPTPQKPKKTSNIYPQRPPKKTLNIHPHSPKEKNNKSIKSSSPASNNIPHHPPHHPPQPPHRLPSIIRIQKIKPFRALHLQDPPVLRRRVEPRWLRAVGDEIEVAVVDADVDEGDVVVE